MLNGAVLKFSVIFILLMTISPRDISAGDINPWTHTFYFENDLFNGTDSNYTNGVKYSIISPDLSLHASEGRLPRKVLEFIHRIPFIRKSPPEFTHKVEFSIGQNMYTPSDTSRSDLIKDDRPYAGWLYLSTSYHRKYSSEGAIKLMDTVEIQLGVVGPASLAEGTQKFVHKMRGLQIPRGWDHQLKNELGAAAVYERKWLIHSYEPEILGYDAIAHAGGALGNVYTYLNAGVEIRFGWNIPADFGASLIRPAGSTRLSVGKDFSAFCFGAVNGRIIARDIFLDGNTFVPSHRIEKKPVVADLAAGIALQYRNLMITWTQILRTKEFDGQKSEHSFGAIALSFSYPLDFSK